jgi:C-terminal processing protease CtpA/Prc
VIRIPSFTAGTTAALKAILQPLDRSRPLVLDLRSNAFGSFEEAARSASLFAPAGPLGELSGRKIETRAFRSEPGERMHESRLVLLVDTGTAGAAELFSAALRDSAARDAGVKAVLADAKKDAKDAVEDPDAGDSFDGEPGKDAEKGLLTVRLVGEPTVGMGFTAQVVRLASGGSLKLSVGKIRTVAGKVLCPKGLQPDDRVYPGPSDDSGKGGDLILQRGLKILSESTARLKAAA